MSQPRRRAWWLAAALPVLLYLPLRAQETPAPPDTAPASAPAPVAAPAPAASPPPASEDKPPTDAPEERVSADNNLSFPVDI